MGCRRKRAMRAVRVTYLGKSRVRKFRAGVAVFPLLLCAVALCQSANGPQPINGDYVGLQDPERQ